MQRIRFFSNARRWVTSIALVVVLLVLGALTPVAHAAGIRYATPGGTGDCSTWANACTLQTALTGSVNGDEIWVASGTYKPTAVTTDRTATFQLKLGVALYGGFTGVETARDQRNPATNVTILSGDIDNNDSQTPIITDLTTVTGNTTNSYHVVTSVSAIGATLDGFTITAGHTGIDTVCSYGYVYCCPGGTIYCGGGMDNYHSSIGPTLTNLAFRGNWASSGGGGLNNYDSSPTLTNVTFSGNSASDFGGGLINYNSNPVLINVTFSGNSANSGGGGGLSNINDSNPMLTNVTFNGNSTTGYGGGIRNINSVNVQISNTIFWGNTAGISGTQIFTDNSIPSVRYSVVQGGCPAGSFCTNIIITDPVLGTLGNYGGATQTLPLGQGSAAIDTASALYCPATDQRGQPRDDLGCDIGAYEMKMTDRNNVSLTPSTAAMTTFGPTRAGIQDLGSTHPGVITVTKVTNWTGGTPKGALGVWWELTAPTNTGLKLNLELCYSTAELGNLTEDGTAHFWRYDGTWHDVGAASFSGTTPNRCAQITGVTDLSRWTIANASPGKAPTAVTLSSFRATMPSLDLGAWLKEFLGR